MSIRYQNSNIVRYKKINIYIRYNLYAGKFNGEKMYINSEIGLQTNSDFF